MRYVGLRISCVTLTSSHRQHDCQCLDFRAGAETSEEAELLHPQLLMVTQHRQGLD
jgi:hypothetical protein